MLQAAALCRPVAALRGVGADERCCAAESEPGFEHYDVMQVARKLFDRLWSGMAILLLAADATARFDGSTGRRKRRTGGSDPAGAVKAEEFRDQGHAIRI